MPLDSRPLDSIDEADLLALIDNGIAESKGIEYKKALFGSAESAKREFLADVSSFANASGGHLVFGIREKGGVATKICGLGDLDKDSEILRIENLLRDGLEPRIPGVAIKAISLTKNGTALVIHVPKRWASPHRVTLKGHGHFYSRNSAGKYFCRRSSKTRSHLG